jgi:hypothetical protein
MLRDSGPKVLYNILVSLLVNGYSNLIQETNSRMQQVLETHRIHTDRKFYGDESCGAHRIVRPTGLTNLHAEFLRDSSGIRIVYASSSDRGVVDAKDMFDDLG